MFLEYHQKRTIGFSDGIVTVALYCTRWCSFHITSNYDWGVMMRDITLLDIFNAYTRIKDIVRQTPFEEVVTSDQNEEGRIYLKCENRQITGSFKIRGAVNKIASLSAVEKSKGVITASSGNHAQGVAYAAQMYRLHAKVIVPISTPINKINATKKLGAEVIIAGDTYDHSELIALDLADRENMTYIHAFNDPEVIAGQGTVGLEMMLEQPSLDQIIIPAGGGGLMTGIAICAKLINPHIRIIGVQSEASAPWYYAMKAGRVVDVAYEETLADGLAGKILDETFQLARQYIDQIVLVKETDIAEAIRWLMSKKQIVEGSGAVGIAALQIGAAPLIGRTGVVLSGGNIDLDKLQKILNGTNSQ